MATVISVIIPAFNAAAYIRDTLESVQKQTLPDWEALVVDDGSADETAAIVRQVAAGDARIHLLQQANAGEAAARAAGLARADSELIYFLDADDLALPDTLERLVAALARAPNAIAAYGNYLRVNDDAVPLFPQGRPLAKEPKPQGDILGALLKRPFFPIGTAAVRKRSISAADILTHTNYSEDWIMWVRLALKGDFIHIEGAPLMKYRLHKASQTQQKTNVAEQMKAIDMVFSMPEIRGRIGRRERKKYRSMREAFCFFSLGCKELRRQDYTLAAEFFRKCVAGGYWNRPQAWAIFILTKARWLPRKLQLHLG